MINAVGYRVSYPHDAFRTSVERDGIRHDQLEGVLEGLAQGIRRLSRGRCIITPQNGFLSKEADAPIDLVVYVPAGSDQYKQMLTAVEQLERGFENLALTLPIDASRRTIEEDGPKCDRADSCERMATWVLHYEGRSDTYFCTGHAQGYVNFDTTGHATFSWEELKPATV